MRAAMPLWVGVLLALAIPRAEIEGQTAPLWQQRSAFALPANAEGVLSWSWTASPVPLQPVPQVTTPGVAKTTAFSALVPGLGQHTLGQDRKWAYWAVEAIGWVLYVDRHRAGGELRDEYMTFAWDEARIQNGARIDGNFGYYETLSKWNRSGAFDGDPGAPGVQPETDPTAYNGSIWALAMQIFLPGGPGVPESDPQYQRALQYYHDRAYGTDFLWDWTGTGVAQDAYGGLITSSDDRFRQATNVLGAIIANHVVSAVDAYLSVRGIATPSEVRVAPTFGPGGGGWSTWVRIPVSR
jgi:hypothetical protein